MSGPSFDLSGLHKGDNYTFRQAERPMSEPMFTAFFVGGSMHGKHREFEREELTFTVRKTGEFYRMVSEAPDGILRSWMVLDGLSRAEELKLRAEIGA